MVCDLSKEGCMFIGRKLGFNLIIWIYRVNLKNCIYVSTCTRRKIFQIKKKHFFYFYNEPSLDRKR